MSNFHYTLKSFRKKDPKQFLSLVPSLGFALWWCCGTSASRAEDKESQVRAEPTPWGAEMVVFSR